MTPVCTLQVVRIRDYCHSLNCVPWDYGPQNEIEPAALEQALLTNKLRLGVICGSLARFFAWKVNKVYEVLVKIVPLSNPAEDHLGHVVVEVQTGDKFELHDPYFNCCFALEDHILSVAGVRKCVKEKRKITTLFHQYNVNWSVAWLAYQKSLLWLAEQILAATDYSFRANERLFWKYLFPWLETGSPTTVYGWKERQYSYWDYFV